MVTYNEYKEYLDSLDDEEVKVWGTKLGGGTTREVFLAIYRDAKGEEHELLERKIAVHSEGKLKTEEQKRTEAIVSSAKAAADSAEAANLSAKIALDAIEETKD